MNVKPTKRPTSSTTDPEPSACRVSMICSHPSESGEMAVEFSFQGDALLAAFLLQKALNELEGQIRDAASMLN